MNYLNGKSVYLCGPIHYQQDSGMPWRESITKKLEEYSIKVLDPTKTSANGMSEVGEDKKLLKELILKENWTELKDAFWPIVRKDLRAVDQADFLICYYDPCMPTIGTIHELVVANFEKKPIFLKYDKSQLGSFNPWLSVLIKTKYFHSSWESLFEHLEQINQGKFDISYWTL